MDVDGRKVADRVRGEGVGAVRRQEQPHPWGVPPPESARGWAGGAAVAGSARHPVALLGILTLMACAFVGLVEAAPAIPLAALSLFLFGLLALSLDRQNASDRSVLYSLFAWGFFLRVVYGFCLYYWLIAITGEPFLGGGDDAGYEWLGKDLFEHWQQKDFILPFYLRYHPGYYVVIAVTRTVGEWMGGYHELLTRIVNACIGGLIAPSLFILARNVFGRPVALVAGIVALAFPNFVFYSSVQLRDIIIVFLFVFSLSQLSRFVVRGQTTGVVMAFVAVLPLFYLRTVFGFVLLTALAISLVGCLLLQKSRSRVHRWRKVFLLGVGVLILRSYMMASESHMVDPGGGESESISVPDSEYVGEKIDLQRAHSTRGATEDSLGAKLISDLPGGVGFLILPVVTFIMPYPPWLTLFTPSPVRFLYFINATVWTLLMPMCLLGGIKGLRRWFPENLLVIVPMVLVLISAGAGGFTDRYKLAAIPFALVFGALGMVMVFKEGNKTLARRYMWIQLGMLTAYCAAKLASL